MPGPESAPVSALAGRTGALGVGCLALGADLVSKRWFRNVMTEATVTRGPVCKGLALPERVSLEVQELLPGLLELRYAENCGAAAGLFQGWPPTLRLAFFAAVVVGVAAVLLHQVRAKVPWAASAAAMAIAGSLGNLIDRIQFGYVIDFLHFPLAGGTINVADIAVVVGLAAFVAAPGLPKATPP